LNTNHLDNLYLFEQRYEDPWLFFEAKRGPQAKKFGKHWIRCLYAMTKPTSIYQHVEF